MQRRPDEFLELDADLRRRYADRPEQMITRRMGEDPGNLGASDERFLIVVEVIDNMINELRWKLGRQSR